MHRYSLLLLWVSGGAAINFRGSKSKGSSWTTSSHPPKGDDNRSPNSSISELPNPVHFPASYLSNTSSSHSLVGVPQLFLEESAYNASQLTGESGGQQRAIDNHSHIPVQAGSAAVSSGLQLEPFFHHSDHSGRNSVLVNSAKTASRTLTDVSSKSGGSRSPFSSQQTGKSGSSQVTATNAITFPSQPAFPARGLNGSLTQEYARRGATAPQQNLGVELFADPRRAHSYTGGYSPENANRSVSGVLDLDRLCDDIVAGGGSDYPQLDPTKHETQVVREYFENINERIAALKKNRNTDCADWLSTVRALGGYTTKADGGIFDYVHTFIAIVGRIPERIPLSDFIAPLEDVKTAKKMIEDVRKVPYVADNFTIRLVEVERPGDSYAADNAVLHFVDIQNLKT